MKKQPPWSSPKQFRARVYKTESRHTHERQPTQQNTHREAADKKLSMNKILHTCILTERKIATRIRPLHGDGGGLPSSWFYFILFFFYPKIAIGLLHAVPDDLRDETTCVYSCMDGASYPLTRRGMWNPLYVYWMYPECISVRYTFSIRNRRLHRSTLDDFFNDLHSSFFFSYIYRCRDALYIYFRIVSALTLICIKLCCCKLYTVLPWIARWRWIFIYV